MTSKADEMKDKQDLAGSTSAMTFHRAAQIQLGLESAGGRFGATAQVIGSVADAGSQYPRLPSNSPSASDPVPDEPPTGYEIDALEVTGNPGEAGVVATSVPVPGACAGEERVDDRASVLPSDVQSRLSSLFSQPA